MNDSDGFQNISVEQANQEVMNLAEAFLRDRYQESFGNRNPELGKMINCPPCDRRHRAARVCLPVYVKHWFETVKSEDGSVVPAPMMADQTTAKGVMGAARFRGRRNKHRNAWGLQVLERATKIYNEDRKFYKEMTDAEEDKLGKMCLSRALNEKRAERAAVRRNLFVIARESRRINRGSR